MISVFLPRRTRETFRRLFQVKYGNGFIYFSKPEKQLYPVLNSENGLVPQQSKRLIGKKSTISLGFSVFNNVEKDGENLKKIHFYLPNLSDLKKFMWMIWLKIHVDNPLGWSGVHVDNLDLELWEWRQVIPCGVGWMWRCYTFVMHGCVRWSGGGQVEKWRLTLLYVRLLLPPLAPVFFLVLNGERKLQEKDRDFFNSLLREKRSL